MIVTFLMLLSKNQKIMDLPHMDYRQKSTILASLSLGTIIIYSPYPHNNYFLLQLSIILFTTFSNPVNWELLGTGIGLTLVKINKKNLVASKPTRVRVQGTTPHILYSTTMGISNLLTKYYLIYRDWTKLYICFSFSSMSNTNVLIRIYVCQGY